MIVFLPFTDFLQEAHYKARAEQINNLLLKLDSKFKPAINNLVAVVKYFGDVKTIDATDNMNTAKRINRAAHKLADNADSVLKARSSPLTTPLNRSVKPKFLFMKNVSFKVSYIATGAAVL